MQCLFVDILDHARQHKPKLYDCSYCFFFLYTLCHGHILLFLAKRAAVCHGDHRAEVVAEQAARVAADCGGD